MHNIWLLFLLLYSTAKASDDHVIDTFNRYYSGIWKAFILILINIRPIPHLGLALSYLYLLSSAIKDEPQGQKGSQERQEKVPEIL